MDGRWLKKTQEAPYGVKYFPERRLYQKLENRVWSPMEPGSTLYNLMWGNRRNATNRFIFDGPPAVVIPPAAPAAIVLPAPKGPSPIATSPGPSNPSAPDTPAPAAEDASSSPAPGPSCPPVPLNKKARQKLARKLRREEERAKKSRLGGEGVAGGVKGSYDNGDAQLS
jgi:hypothetical protein